MNDFFKFFDKTTFFVLLIIIIIGALLVFSASHGSNSDYFLKHLIKIAVSLILFFIIFKIKLETIYRWSFSIYVLLIVILVLQLLTGKIISGTKSWIKMGVLSIQISEFIKIPLALILSRYLTKISILNWKTFLWVLIVVMIPFTLISLQPDMGTAFILISFIVIAVLLRKINPSIIVISLIIFVVGSYGMWNYMLKPYQKERITSFLNPAKYSKSSGYQIIQSRIAFGSGGLTGEGFLKGSQSRYKFLPTRHTDFIASVLGEEFGFMGISLLLLLFFTLFYRQFNFRVSSGEEFFFIYLFSGLILFQFIINILMVTGLFPVLGIPLPFVSYGGSSMLAFSIGEGIIFKMKVEHFLQQE